MWCVTFVTVTLLSQSDQGVDGKNAREKPARVAASGCMQFEMTRKRQMIGGRTSARRLLTCSLWSLLAQLALLLTTLLTMLLPAAQLAAQNAQSSAENVSGEPGRAAIIKVNASTLVGIPGIAYEIALTDRTSLNIDATASVWRSVRGVPFQFLTIVPEWQLHSRSERSAWYGGVHLGAAIYRLQKWDYWGSRRYQEGFSTLLGATIGYKRALSSSLMFDAYLGGGSQHGRYRGYDAETGELYAGADRLDESREWLPYRVGLMIGYKLR